MDNEQKKKHGKVENSDHASIVKNTDASTVVDAPKTPKPSGTSEAIKAEEASGNTVTSEVQSDGSKEKKKEDKPHKGFFRFGLFFKYYFDVRREKESERATVDSIENGVELRGVKLWVLVCAIFIASLGLNVNSTAVVIGAMLISPLMGPVMGMGLSIGQNNFELLKRSAKSFGIVTLISVLTSTLFFLLIPLGEAQSELLARTSPTIYDVFIALIGGLAGVIALSTKEKGNVIPGVAIATALMPPLCTAGYGLATGNLSFFFGAFYLYFINSVFIALSTLLGTKILHYHKKEFLDPARARQVKMYIFIIATVTMLPAAYLTVGIIQGTLFESRVKLYVDKELDFPGTQVLSRNIINNDSTKELRVVLIGNEVSDASVQMAQHKMADYKLEHLKLSVLQGMGGQNQMNIQTLRSLVMEDFYKNSEERLVSQTMQIDSLTKKLGIYQREEVLSREILPEVKLLFPHVEAISLGNSLQYHIDNAHTDTLHFALVKFRTLEHPDKEIQTKLEAWLKTRLQVNSIELIEQYPTEKK